MHPACRHLHALVAATLIAAVANVAKADESSVSREAEYLRLHDSALAFAKTVEVRAERYAGLRAVDMDQVRRLIAQSEQAAQLRQFDAASMHARQAYEMLRAAITGAVAEDKQQRGN